MIPGPWWVPPRVRRRILRFALVALGVFGMVSTAAILIAVITAPAAAPVIAAATVLGRASEVFGDNGGEMTGDELARAGEDSELVCAAAPAADTGDLTSVPTTPAVLGKDSYNADSGEDEDEPATVDPVRLGEGGSITPEDVEMLLEPLTPGTSTLRAHVWFLYRLAGLGDWAQFTTAYEQAELSPDEDSANAPLRQVQELNVNGLVIERYRLTAAALTEAGQRTGRFSDPYPEYRDLVSVELISNCLADAGEQRMTLPAPATTAISTPAAVPEPR